MIKRKLIATKTFVKDHSLEIGLGVLTFAALAAGAAVDAELSEEPTKTEVYETASHTVIIIPN